METYVKSDATMIKMINKLNKLYFSATICLFLLFLPTVLYAQETTDKDNLDSLMKMASEAEKMEDCETAYNLYNSALGEVELLDTEKYKNKVKELRSVLTTKLYKLESCYKGCNPSERQKALFERAKLLSEEGQRKRMIQILRRMLIGKNEKCAFWKKVRSFLNTIPGEENINENADPCEVPDELKSEMNTAREEVKRLSQEILKYTKINSSTFSKKVDDLINFFRAIEESRLKIYQYREEFMDCDEVYKSLADDSNRLKSMYEQTRDIIVSGYKNIVSDMANKVANLKKQLKLKEEEIGQIKDEYTKLQTKLDALSQFNEQIFNDLFALANIESIKPTLESENKKLISSFENVNEIIKDERKVIEAIQQKYPEYFENGVNLEALKRKKFVVEKMSQMLERFKDAPYGQTIGFNKTLDELNATAKMMDLIIKNTKPKINSTSVLADNKWLVIVFILLVIIGTSSLVAGIILLKRRNKATDVQ